jgi:predicted lipoprotein with Yx(FWY)xxD motif
MTTNFKQGRLVPLGLVGLVAVVVAVAGCGGSSGSASSTPSTAASSAPAASGAYGAPASPAPAAAKTTGGATAVDLATSKLGKILVDSKGRTLYLFEADKGSSSTCNGACAGAWPPLTTTKKPTAGTGVSASLLGTTKRSDGSLEVTYGGHPLYYFEADTAAGETSGQGLTDFGAPWYAVSATGTAVK